MNSGLQDRIARLARALGMEPTKFVSLRLETGARRRWWLTGCIGGDQPLPQTQLAHTVYEALDAAEAWLAPELDNEEEP